MSRTQFTVPIYIRHRPLNISGMVGLDVIIPELRTLLEVRSGQVMFVGPNGHGKSTLAGLYQRRLECQNPSGLDICYACDQCHELSVPHYYDCDFLTGSKLNHAAIDLLERSFAYPSSTLSRRGVLLDDLDVSRQDIQQRLVPLLNEYPDRVFIATATDLRKLFLPLLQRMHVISLPKPSAVAFESLVKEVSLSEGVPIESSEAVTMLSTVCDRNPRVLLLALEKIKSMAGGLTVDNVLSSSLKACVGIQLGKISYE